MCLLIFLQVQQCPGGSVLCWPPSICGTSACFVSRGPKTCSSGGCMKEPLSSSPCSSTPDSTSRPKTDQRGKCMCRSSPPFWSSQESSKARLWCFNLSSDLSWSFRLVRLSYRVKVTLSPLQTKLCVSNLQILSCQVLRLEWRWCICVRPCGTRPTMRWWTSLSQYSGE